MDDFEEDHGFQGVSEGRINRRQQNVKGWIWGGGGRGVIRLLQSLPLPLTPYPLPLTPYLLPLTPYPLPPTPTPRQQIMTGPKLFVSCKSVWVFSQLSTKLRRLKMLPVKYLSWLGCRVAFLFSVFDVLPPLHCCEDLLHWQGHGLGSPLTHP